MSPQYKNAIFTKLDTELTSKKPRFIYYDDKNHDACQSFIRQFLDAEQEMHGKLLTVHKPKEEGAFDDFLISTALANDALETAPPSKIEFQTSGESRKIKSELSDY